jgi:WhiB family redox-sensing transcriptional regulator
MRQLWRDLAACAGMETHWWFPNNAGTNWAAKRAKDICDACPVQQECLDFALTHDVEYGIWGGRSPNERRLLRRGFKHGPGGRLPQEG